MHRVKKYAPLLNALVSADRKTRAGIVRSAPDEFITTLVEIVFNFLRGNIKVSTKTFKRLKKKRRSLRNMTKSKPGEVRNLLQRGGFLGFLLPMIGTAIAAKTMVPHIVKNATNTALDTVENRAKALLDKL